MKPPGNASASPNWYTCDIDRKILKGHFARDDMHALVHLGVWFALLGVTGYLGFLSWGTWWAVPAFLAYGTLYAGAEARAHELGHGTPFRTAWLNTVFYHITSFIALREAYYCKWRHSVHHTHTIATEHDPEIQVKRPADLVKIGLDFFYIIGGWQELKKITLHALGIMTSGVKAFVPQSEWRNMVWSSRAYLAVMALVILFAIWSGSFLPLMYVALPRFYGGWFHQLCGLTQHAGLAEEAEDHRLNTRTVYMDPVSQFLYFNMNYHLEHHLYPMVPFHALPRLHARLKDQLPPAYDGFIDVYAEILPALWRQSRDPSFFVDRTAVVAKLQAA